MTELRDTRDTHGGYGHHRQTRVDVANAVLAIVQQFAGETPSPTMHDAEVAEQAVRDIAERAEGTTLNGEVVCGALNREFLLDDYLRIKRGDHSDAFESPSLASNIPAGSKGHRRCRD